MIGMGLSKDVISVILGKDLSSVYRELNRNSGEGIYTGREAHYEAEARRREAKDSPKMNDPLLMGIVMDLFKKDYSPDQIAGRLRSNYPETPEMWVSYETIYQYVYRKMPEEPGLKRHFRHPRPHRRSRTGRQERRGQIPDRNSRENRPAMVDEKIRIGDWEGDTVEGAGKTAYIATFVEKTSKFLVAKVMANKAAATLNRAAIRAFNPIPDACIKTMTFDNGKEFSCHKALAAALGCDIYFAHPYHSWERGLNEHTNGLIRQYLPKKTSFDTLTQRQLDRIIAKINNRPRKALGYRTPHEVFSERKFALQI
jgi:IS30 family transposase